MATANDHLMANQDQPKQVKVELDVLLFENDGEWLAWLEENHANSSGVWLRFAKKNATLCSVSYAQALEVALCFGWIDGQKKTFDSDSWLQKFTPRSRQSLWSKVNRDKANALIESGQMRVGGLREVERAKEDGRWEAAYDPASQAQVPDDFAAQLEAHPKAREFFESLNKQNRYAILFRLQTAKKPETRAKRIEQFISMLEREEKIYP